MIVKTSCCSHCGGQCILRAHVANGTLTALETDTGTMPQLRACLRGRAYRQRIYDPGRLRYPMKRIGKRGEGSFRRISWDEALDTIASELKRVYVQYGPASVLYVGGGGDTMELHRQTLFAELLARAGGYTTTWGVASHEAGLFSSTVTYGTMASQSNPDDLLNSRLIILWGCDPATTIHRTGTASYLARAREGGARIVSVDPRCTPSTAAVAGEWIPIIPGTDAAMLIAMAHVIISERYCDQAFLDRYTIGFDRFRDYVMGDEDGVARSPEWAEAITGVPAATIARLAIDYASSRPAALLAGTGPGRTAYGEQYHRAAEVLSAMTGNTGIPGGWCGRFHNGMVLFGGFNFKLRMLSGSKGNPLEAGAGRRPGAIATLKGSDSAARVHFADLADAILKGKAGGYPADLKLAVSITGNPINQFPNTRHLAAAFERLEFVAVLEQVMTATARYADILIPHATYLERNDLVTGGVAPVYTRVKQAVAPLGEARSILDIANALAPRLGLAGWDGKTEDEWLREMVKESYVPDVEEFWREGTYRVPLSKPFVAFREQIEDPRRNPFPTPSGKIEIYSERLAVLDNPLMPPIPRYIETWEGRRDPLAAKYPLQLLTTHMGRRAHSQYDSLPWLRQIAPQGLTMNVADASVRGIGDGDWVRVFNDRGEVKVQAIVTERIVPGVVDLPQGAWYAPDENGVDRGGCANVLTNDTRSPAGAACHHTCLVQVEKVA